MAAVILNPPIGARYTEDGAITDHPIYGTRPSLRGRFHQVAALLSLPIGVHLVVAVAGPSTRLATIVYTVTCTLMFGTSAAYHRLAKGILARFWMRRLDHSMIYVHIAGVTTPIALLGVGGLAGKLLLTGTWAGALVGMGLKMTRLTADHDPCPWLFPVLGWLPLTAVPNLTSGHGVEMAALLVAAAGVYAGGAVCFARKAPDPIPRVFGYHEVWHVFTLLGGGLQLALVLRLVAL